MPKHAIANWRHNPDYLLAYEFIPPGTLPDTATLNSCSSKQVSPTVQCSGRGFCREMTPSLSGREGSMSLAMFCKCDRDWADPECRTRRKSQKTAFLLSLFLGVLGADCFYLGFPLWGLAKLASAGGFGFWWLLDIIRTGSGPVYAADFRVAEDLPHWMYMVVTVLVFVLLSFALSVYSYLSFRSKKRAEQMQFQSREENLRNQQIDYGQAVEDLSFQPFPGQEEYRMPQTYASMSEYSTFAEPYHH